MNTILEELRQKIAPERVLTKEPMKKHTTFRIGGEAELYIIPETIEEVQWTVKTARKHEIPMFILGNGSNLLVGDRGIDGIVLQIYKNMNEITVNGTEITAQAGALLSSIAREAQNRSLTGFEFAGGIPRRDDPGFKRGHSPHERRRDSYPFRRGTGAWVPYQQCHYMRIYSPKRNTLFERGRSF